MAVHDPGPLPIPRSPARPYTPASPPELGRVARLGHP